jgi:hypothetical protein
MLRDRQGQPNPRMLRTAFGSSLGCALGNDRLHRVNGYRIGIVRGEADPGNSRTANERLRSRRLEGGKSISSERKRRLLRYVLTEADKRQ